MNLPSLPIKNPPVEHVRQRCYNCYRPEYACFCDAIPQVANRTKLLILQHRKERTHPFNSARIVHQSLQSCELIVGRNMELAKMDLGIERNVGLLYPRKQAMLLDDLVPGEIPEQFVFLDGTWNHARTMYRDIPVLKTLPCYRLVAVLRQFEPELAGLDRLMAAFDLMNQQQVDELKRRKVKLRGR